MLFRIWLMRLGDSLPDCRRRRVRCKDQRQQSINTKLFPTENSEQERKGNRNASWKSGWHAEKGQGGPEKGRGSGTKRKPFFSKGGGKQAAEEAQLVPGISAMLRKILQRLVWRGTQAFPAFRRLPQV